MGAVVTGLFSSQHGCVRSAGFSLRGGESTPAGWRSIAFGDEAVPPPAG
jgi:hypothetical protein